MTTRTAAILGASRQHEKFGNKSVRAHLQRGYTVYPINPSGGTIEGLTVYKSLRDLPVERLNRISVYLPPAMTMELISDLQAMPCDELWLNPGAESHELVTALRAAGIEPIIGCSIVELGISPSSLP